MNDTTLSSIKNSLSQAKIGDFKNIEQIKINVFKAVLNNHTLIFSFLNNKDTLAEYKPDYNISFEDPNNHQIIDITPEVEHLGLQHLYLLVLDQHNIH